MSDFREPMRQYTKDNPAEQLFFDKGKYQGSRPVAKDFANRSEYARELIKWRRSLGDFYMEGDERMYARKALNQLMSPTQEMIASAENSLYLIGADIKVHGGDTGQVISEVFKSMINEYMLENGYGSGYHE